MTTTTDAEEEISHGKMTARILTLISERDRLAADVEGWKQSECTCNEMYNKLHDEYLALAAENAKLLGLLDQLGGDPVALAVRMSKMEIEINKLRAVAEAARPMQHARSRDECNDRAWSDQLALRNALADLDTTGGEEWESEFASILKD
jgi:hypothetical protein